MAIGRYNDELRYTSRRPVVGASVLVKKTTDGTAAVLFTDEGGGSPAGNPIDYEPAAPGETGLDHLGNLTFYASGDAPGPAYDIVVTTPRGVTFDALRVWVDVDGGGAGDVTQAELDDAIAAEAADRSEAIAALSDTYVQVPDPLADGEVPTWDEGSGTWVGTTPGTGGGSTPDATAVTKGKLQLAGDLGGTAASPTVPGLAARLVSANNLSDVASAATARTNLGLGTAATQASGAFDAAGVASSAVSTHAGLSDPHPGYLTPAEGNAAYDAAGAAATAQAFAIQRGNHTGTQAESTVTGLVADLAAKADLVGGKVPDSQMGSLVISEHLGVVASQAAMLALVGQRGDWCTRSDLSADFMVIAEPTSSLGNWRQFSTPASPVSSVNGRTGAVTGLAEGTDLTGEIARAMAAELLLAPLAGPGFTGNPTAPTQTTGNNSTRLATTAFVTTAADAKVADAINDGTTGVAPSQNAVFDALALKAQGLVPTAVKTSAYTAAAGDFVPVDTTSGAVTVTLPTTPADGARIGIKHVIQGGTNTVSYTCGGSDVLNKAGGATSGTLTLLAQAVSLQYKASSGIWYVVADDMPLSQLDSRYVSTAGSTSTGEQVAPSFKATGKTGATATPITLAGGTASGAPASGAHVKGELVLDDTGVAWYCTVAGTPGTWVQVGGGGGGSAEYPWLVDIVPWAALAVSNVNYNSISQSYLYYGGGAYNSVSGLQNDEVSYPVVLGAGVWSLDLLYIEISQGGIFSLSIDGTAIGTVDSYNAARTDNKRASITGIVVATSGKKVLRLLMASKNASSSAYFGYIIHVHLQRTA